MTSEPRRPTGSKKQEAPLESYLREINEVPLLSADQEFALASRIAKGDEDARLKMIRANLRLVVSIARDYTGRGVELADLIEEGNLGLFNAVERYNPEFFQTRFSTYGSYWIKQSIQRAIINTAKIVRVPAWLIDLQRKWKGATAELLKRNGTAPSDGDIAQHIGISQRRLNRVLFYFSCAERQMHSRGHEDADADMANIPDSQGDPALVAMHAEILQKANALLASLDPREEEILSRRYGFSDESQTLQEIGEQLGITKERVRQIEARALEKMRKALGDAPSSWMES